MPQRKSYKRMVALFILTAVTILYAYALCSVAARSEMQARREDEMLEAQKAYNEYRQRFAHYRKISIKDATDYQAVKNYKKYLEEEYNVKISEGGVDNER